VESSSLAGVATLLIQVRIARRSASLAASTIVSLVGQPAAAAVSTGSLLPEGRWFSGTSTTAVSR